MIALIRKLQHREPSRLETKVMAWFKTKSKSFRFWLIRVFIARKYVTISWTGYPYEPELGDIYMKKGVGMEYVGKDRWVGLPEDYRPELKLGVRIKAHYYAGKKNNYIVRHGEIILWA